MLRLRPARHRGTKLIATACFGFAAAAHNASVRADETWLGLTSSWDNPTNWSGDTVPNLTSPYDVADFAGTYTAGFTQPTVSNNETFNTLELGSGWDVGGAGTLSIGTLSDAVAGVGTVDANLVARTGSLTFSVGSLSSVAVNSALTGTGTLTLTGTGSVLLNGANTFSGTFSSSGATTLVAGSSAAFGTATLYMTTTTFTQALVNASAGSLSIKALSTVPTINSIGTLSITSANGYGLSIGSWSNAGGSLNIAGTSGITFGLNNVSMGTFLTLASNTANFSVGSISNIGNATNLLDLDGTTAGNVVSGPIAGNIELYKTNTSTWTLTAANTNTSTNGIRAGTLAVADSTVYGPGNATITNSGLGSGNVVISGGATLSLLANGTSDSTAQTLSYANFGTILLAAVNTNIDIGPQSGSGTNKTLQLPNLNAQGSGTITITSANNYGLSFANLLDGYGTLTVAGTSGITFGLNNVAFDTADELELASTTARFVVGSVSSVGTSTNSAITLDGTSTANTITGAITGNLSLFKTNTGIWTLTGANTFSAGTEVEAGTLVISDSTAYGPGNATVTNSGLGTGSVELYANGTLSLRANGANDSTAQSLAYANFGTFIINGGTNNTIVVGPQSGTGTNKILQLPNLGSNDGTITVLSTSNYGLAFGSLAAATGEFGVAGTSGITFGLNNVSIGFGNLAFASNTANFAIGSIASTGSNTSVLDLDGTTSGNIINGAISGSISLNKTNNSTWTLAGTSSFAAGAYVSSGTLVTTGQITTPALSVNSGTFVLNGGDLNAGSLYVASNAAFVWTSGTANVGTFSVNTSSTTNISAGSFTASLALVGAGSTSGSGGTGSFTQTGGATNFGILSAGNTGTLTAGYGTGTISVSGGTLYADTVLLGSTAGGSGAMTVSGSANVTVGGGAHLNDLTVNGGTFTVLDQTPPAGEDPVLNYAIVGGYLTNGALNVGGTGVVSSPLLKLGVTAGDTGTLTQTGGSITLGILGVGNDGTLTSGSGTGVANISAGSLYADTILLGSTAGGSGAMTVSGTANVTVGGGAHLNDLTVNGGTLTVLNQTPPAGEDPELNYAVVGGYLSSGAFNVGISGFVSTPYIKMGITSGKTGTFNQSGGTVDVGTLTLGSDTVQSSGSGIGQATISGGTLSIGTLLVSSTAGGVGTLAISGTANVTAAVVSNAGTITVSGGTTSFGTIDGAGTFSTMGGSLVATHIRQNLLSIGSSAAAAVALSSAAGTTSATSVLTDLSNSGTLDLTNNDLIVNDPSQYANVKAQIINAQNGGNWNQPGITSSSAAANHLTGLGYGQVGSGSGQLNVSSFDGQPVSSGATLVKYTLYGDLLLTGSVTANDFNIILPNYNKTVTGGWAQGDLFGTGQVTAADFNAMLPNYNKSDSMISPNLVSPALRTATRSLSVSPALTLYSWDAQLPSAQNGQVVLKVDDVTTDSNYGDVILQGNNVTIDSLHITSASGTLQASTTDTKSHYNSFSDQSAGTDQSTDSGGHWSLINATTTDIYEAGIDHEVLTFTSNAESLDMAKGTTAAKTGSPAWPASSARQLFVGLAGDLTATYGDLQGNTDPITVEYFSSTQSTPEPGSITLLAIGSVALMRRRRKQARTLGLSLFANPHSTGRLA